MSDDAPIETLLLDVIETYYGEWLSEQRVFDIAETVRPGIDRESVGRMLRKIKAAGGGHFIAPCTSGNGWQDLLMTVECRGDVLVEVRMPTRSYW